MPVEFLQQEFLPGYNFAQQRVADAPADIHVPCPNVQLSQPSPNVPDVLFVAGLYLLGLGLVVLLKIVL